VLILSSLELERHFHAKTSVEEEIPRDSPNFAYFIKRTTTKPTEREAYEFTEKFENLINPSRKKGKTKARVNKNL
jgi:hypothetical protein